MMIGFSAASPSYNPNNAAFSAMGDKMSRLTTAVPMSRLTTAVPKSRLTTAFPIKAAIFPTPKIGAMVGVKVASLSAASSSFFSTKAAAFAPPAVFNRSSFRSKYSRIQANRNEANLDGDLTESSPGKKNAAILVSDTTDLAFLVRGLQELGDRIVSTREKASALESEGICVTKVEDLLDFELAKSVPILLRDSAAAAIKRRRDFEILGDAVLRGEIISDTEVDIYLARQKEALDKQMIGAIEIVVVDLPKIPSGISFYDLIWSTDFKGINEIFTAARNYKDVLVVVDPSDYPAVLEFLHGKQDDQQFRKKLADKALQYIHSYLDAVPKTANTLKR